MEEKDLNYIKVCCKWLSNGITYLHQQMINAGERLIVNNRSFGYLSNRIVFYLLNLHIKSRRTYFVRVGIGPSHASMIGPRLTIQSRRVYRKRPVLTSPTLAFLNRATITPGK